MSLVVHVVLVLVQVLLASLSIAGKVVFRELPPPVVVLFRVGGATLGLSLLRALGPRERVLPRDRLRLAVLGLLGITANQTLYLTGLSHSTAINATILVTTAPVFAVLLAVLTRQEPSSGFKFGGIALAAVGAVYLIGPDRISLAPDLALGNALIVIGMVAYAAYLVYSKPLLQRYHPITVITWVMTCGFLGVLPWGLHAAGSVSLGRVSPATWAWLGYIILGPTILAYFLTIWTLKRASSNLVAAYLYLQPLVAAVIAPMVLSGERLTGRAVLAGLTIFAGLALVIMGERSQRRELPAASLVGE